MLISFYKTTVGKKIVVALSGAFLVFFVIGHMVGNLKFFGSVDPASGQHKLDHYAHFLRTIGSDLMGEMTFLWIFRVLLLAAVFAHVVTVILLAKQNRAARGSGYLNPAYSSSTIASRYMFWGGLTLLCFIVFHILHFTTGDAFIAGNVSGVIQGFVPGQVFNNVVSGFSVWYVVMFYVIAMFCLGLHIYHGAWSMFQTVGIDNPSTNKTLRLFAKLLALVLFIGFCSVPVIAYFGNYSLIPVK